MIGSLHSLKRRNRAFSAWALTLFALAVLFGSFGHQCSQSGRSADPWAPPVLTAAHAEHAPVSHSCAACHWQSEAVGSIPDPALALTGGSPVDAASVVAAALPAAPLSGPPQRGPPSG